MSTPFTTYKQTIATSTLAREQNDLKQFADSLGKQGICVSGEQLFQELNSQAEITAVHLQAFIKHQLAQSFTPSTINVRLATLRRYNCLIYATNALDEVTMKEITAVSNLPTLNTKTRRGHKKTALILLTDEDAT